MYRGKLWETLRSKGVRIFDKEDGEDIWENGSENKDEAKIHNNSEQGVRQGCVMSPLLFNLYIADIDKELEKREIGRIRLGKDRIWSLTYADDLILVA